MSSWPEVQPATLLLSDSASLLGLYRKVLCVVRSEEAGGRDLYSLLYPPGWCLLEDLEERHRSGQDLIKISTTILHSRRLWRDVGRFVRLDCVGQVIVRICYKKLDKKRQMG